MNDKKAKIKELKVLEKLLEQDFINFTKKGLGDEEAVASLNALVKDFLSKYLDSIFSGGTIAEATFSPEAAAVLNEFANRLLAKARAGGSLPLQEPETPQAPPTFVPEEAPTNDNIHTSPLTRKSVRHQGSPVLEALRGSGFDPNAPVAERVKAIKKIAKDK